MNKVKNMKKIVSVLVLGLSVLLTSNGFASPGNFLKRGLEKANQRVQKTLNGNSALHCAVKSGNLQSVKLVYKKHPELIEKVNDKRETPLFTAVNEGDEAVLSIIIYLVKDCGANVNIVNNEDQYLLVEALPGKRSDVIRWLLAAGANPNVKDSFTLYSALDISIYLENYEIAIMFLASGANVNERDPEGEKLNLERYCNNLVREHLTFEKAISEELEKLIELRRQINDVREDNGKDKLPELPQISDETMNKLHSEFELALQRRNECRRKNGCELFIIEGYKSIADGQRTGECVYGVRS